MSVGQSLASSCGVAPARAAFRESGYAGGPSLQADGALQGHALWLRARQARLQQVLASPLDHPPLRTQGTAPCLPAVATACTNPYGTCAGPATPVAALRRAQGLPAARPWRPGTGAGPEHCKILRSLPPGLRPLAHAHARHLLPFFCPPGRRRVHRRCSAASPGAGNAARPGAAQRAGAPHAGRRQGGGAGAAAAHPGQ